MAKRRHALINSHGSSDKAWSFLSPSGASGVYFYGGYYLYHSAAFTPAGGTAIGTANASYAAHAFIVLGATSTDMVVRVSGTSINDAGTRATSDTEDIDTSGGAANDYYETTKKWLGQPTYTLQSGTGVIINAGLAKYWDNNNSNFTVIGCEATWLGGANDAAPDIQLLHHKLTGWTYAAGGTAVFPTAIASMATDHSTEDQVVNGENGAWKRSDLNVPVAGGASEGVLYCITTTANKTFDLGNLLVKIEPGRRGL